MGDIEYVGVSFTCSICKVRFVYQLPFVPTQKHGKRTNMEYQSWCTRCHIGFKIKYHLRKTRKGLLKLKVLLFESQDTVHKKRFTVLQSETLTG